MFKEKMSFLDRLSSVVNAEGDDDALVPNEDETQDPQKTDDWMREETSEGELTVDMYQTPNEIIIQTMIAGVKPEELDVTINREMVTIKGKRERDRILSDENYFYQELYWGTFSRTILLPQEVEPDEAEASERNGLLTIRLPKIDKEKVQTLRVKTK